MLSFDSIIDDDHLGDRIIKCKRRASHGSSTRGIVEGRHMPTRQEVASFLGDFKAAVSLGHVHWLSRSDETKAHLSGLMITRDQATSCLLSLTPDNYSKGPESDDFNETRQVWTFGCDVNGVEAYIKVTMQQDPRRTTVVNALIWSFHAAEHPLKYPLRDDL
jgi:hypothetical protein